MAAEMALTRLPGVILGEAVATCLAMMGESLAPAASALAPIAHAMTDVTGFGLAGHLLEICEASNTGATLRLADLPLLPAAEALAEAGEASSLAPQNRAACLGRITGDQTSTRKPAAGSSPRSRPPPRPRSSRVCQQPASSEP
jgi:selenide,water dikinase